MKTYKRLKLFRMFGPIIIFIPMITRQNFFVILLVVSAWILIDLKIIEPKLPRHKKRKEGEVFVIEPLKDTFLFGKVIRTQIPTIDPNMNGGHLIFIYQQTINPLEIPDTFNPRKLLIPPQIIDNKAWENGYFQTVGAQKVNNDERELNYGFWDIVTNKFVNEEGEELNQTPDVYDDYGLTSYGVIKDELRKVLNVS